MFFSAFSIAITSLEEERANLNAFRTFVRFALVWFCLFPLPLGVWEMLRFVIVALPGLFSYLFFYYVVTMWVAKDRKRIQTDSEESDQPDLSLRWSHTQPCRKSCDVCFKIDFSSSLLLLVPRMAALRGEGVGDGWGRGGGVLTSTHNLCFEQKYEKFQFLSEKFSVFGVEIFYIFD